MPAEKFVDKKGNQVVFNYGNCEIFKIAISKLYCFAR